MGISRARLRHSLTFPAKSIENKYKKLHSDIFQIYNTYRFLENFLNIYLFFYYYFSSMGLQHKSINKFI